MNELISVIVPVYNSELYLAKSLDSICAQSYKNIEIILVNDGSKDNSITICREYERKDSRVLVIDKKENEGAGFARNRGLDIAKGRYITFVDSDDFIAENYLAELYGLIKRTRSDIAICLGKVVYSLKRDSKVEIARLEDYEGMNAKEAIENLCYQRKFTPGPWAKLFSAELFANIRFPNTGYEDLAIIYKILDKAKLVVCSQVEKYYYVQRKDNTTMGAFNLKKLDRIEVVEELKQYVDIRYPELREATVARLFLANIQTLYVLPGEMINTEECKLIEKNIKKYRMDVLKNVNAKKSLRIMALASFMGIRFLYLLGKLYSWFRGKYSLRLS